MAKYSQTELHELIIDSYFRTTFAQWNKHYQFPNAVRRIITNYSKYDTINFLDTSNIFSYNKNELFENIDDKFSKDDNGMIKLKQNLDPLEFKCSNNDFRYGTINLLR